MLDDKLRAIMAEKERYGSSPQPAAHPSTIATLMAKAMDYFGTPLAPAYAQVLATMDGIDENGYVVYASSTQKLEGYDDRFIEGIIDANETWREDTDKRAMVIYAESGLDLFVYTLGAGKYHKVDRITLDIFETYGSDEELFVDILESMLG